MMKLRTAMVVLAVVACGSDPGLQDATTIAPTTSVGGGSVAPSSTATASGASEVAWPEPRLHPSLLVDPTSDRLLMMSGLSAMQRQIDMREVWALDASSMSWDALGDVAPYDALISFGVDEASEKIVAFSLVPPETWAYDPAVGVWERRQPPIQPESTRENPRFGAPLVYDAESDRLILFGGGSPWFMYSGTWAYDYDTDVWEEMSPDRSPSPRAMYAATYDARSDRVLLWGGFTGTDENDVSMWAYDYNSDRWEQLENVDGPQQHWERHGMAWIPGLDQTLFYSGMLEDEGVLPSETWLYDHAANTWSEVVTETAPHPMAMYGMTYHPASERVYLFGGELTSKYAGDTTADLWVFDPVAMQWTVTEAPDTS